MQPNVLSTLQAWVIGALIYPGLLLGAALALAGEWLVASLHPVWTPRLYRTPARPHHLLQPLYNFLKMAGRQGNAYPALRPLPMAGQAADSVVQAACAIAPVLALSLLPLPGSPLVQALGPLGDLLTVLALLAVQPLCRAVLRLRSEGAALRGAQDVGRLVVGLVPALLAVAALVEVSGSGSLALAGLSAAPESAFQFLVRVLSGAALLAALPMWLDTRGTTEGEESAGTYAGGLLQRAALAALWAYLVLPAPGDLPWALVVAVGGTLAAYLGMHWVAERWAPGRREHDAAGLVWATALPVALVALLAALWSGA